MVDAPLHKDERDTTPFLGVSFHSPLLKFVTGLGRRKSGPAEGPPPSRLEFRTAPRVGAGTPHPGLRTLHSLLRTTHGPAPYVRLAREHPGSAGLLYMLAGLRAYQQQDYERASDYFARGSELPVDHATREYIRRHLMGLMVKVRLDNLVSIHILYSEEAIRFAAADSLRELGAHEDAARLLIDIPNSPAKALALAHLAMLEDEPGYVLKVTHQVRNSSDLTAAILITRARALRQAGRYKEADAALAEVHRRTNTAAQLRTAALTEKGVLVLDAGLKVATNRNGTVKKKSRTPQKNDHRDWDKDFKDLGS